MKFRDYSFLGTTQSLCPDCLEVVPAKVIAKGKRVYFRKTCPRHGSRDDFVCSDVSWFDKSDYSLPGKLPQGFGTEVRRGCPYDCGLCEEHEQHTCIGLMEINSACNLKCPMCFAVSGPQGEHLPLETCLSMIDRLVEVEGQPEVLQISGGEPTIHPHFDQILQYACEQPIDIVMVNTNGVRIARDAAFVDRLAEWKHRVEIYLQFDGFTDEGYEVLRGERLLDTKLRAIERLGEHGLRTILVSTVQPGVNDGDLSPMVDFAAERPWITGVSFQPATYSGRCVLPDELEHRITFPDIIQGIASQSTIWQENDFAPLPCAHPNAHTLAYAFRWQGQVVPLARFVKLQDHLELLSGRITFSRERARQLIMDYLAKQMCGKGDCAPDQIAALQSVADIAGVDADENDAVTIPAAREFFRRALVEQLDPEDMLRITTTSFMDAYNFDIRQLMKSCVHFILPAGHLVPFSAWNVLYRPGHLELPPLSVEHVELQL